MSDDEGMQPPPRKKIKVGSNEWLEALALHEEIRAMWKPDIAGWYDLFRRSSQPRYKAWYYSMYMRAQHLRNEELHKVFNPDHDVYYPTNHCKVTDFEKAKQYALSLPSSNRLRMIFEIAMDREGADEHPDNKENIDPTKDGLPFEA